MKKFIIYLSILVFFVMGWRGDGCDNATDWEFDEPVNDIKKGVRFNFITFTIETYAIAVGNNGKVYSKIFPFTGPWTEGNSNTNKNIHSVCDDGFSDVSINFLCGSEGYFGITTDGGLTCNTLNSGTTDDLNSCSFYGDDINRVFSVGNNGVCVEGNFGTLELKETGTSQNLNCVYSKDQDATYACGDEGTFLKLDNDFWVPVILPTGADLNNIGSMGEEPGEDGSVVNITGVVGDSGTCFKTSDNVTWTSVETGTTEDLYDINFRNFMEGYVAGANGIVRYTIDGGETWYTYDTSPLAGLFTDTIRASDIINDTSAVAVAGNKIYFVYEEESVLPVELSSFTYSIRNNDVLLLWTTASEVNNSGFEIERSSATGGVNGQTSDVWNKIGFINGHGTVGSQKVYEFTDRSLISGKYKYRLKQIDYNGNFEYHNLSNEVVIGAPEKFELSQNYPNPFNPTTNLGFGISEAGFVSLKIYDVLGNEVKTLVNEIKQPGSYKVVFDGSNLASGLYFYKILAGDFSAVKRMTLIK